MLRSLLIATAVLGSVIGLYAFWVVDYHRTLDDCSAYPNVPRQFRLAGSKRNAEWSWTKFDWICLYKDRAGRIERRPPPLIEVT